MKKHINNISIFLTIILIFSSISVFAYNEIKIAIDGDYIDFDVAPQIINNRTMVPLRAIFESLGADVEWDNDTQTVIAVKDDITVTTTIGSTIMYVNNTKKIIDTAPIIISGRTLIPVRFIAEAFDCEVEWDGDNNIVDITSSYETDYYYSDQD